MSTPKHRPRLTTCAVVSVVPAGRFIFVVTLGCGAEKLRQCANAPQIRSMKCCGRVPPARRRAA